MVDVKLDAGVGGSVELGANNTIGLLGTAAGNLNVDALGIVLGTVLLGSGVERNDFVAEDVLARGKVLGDSHGPGVVVGNQLVGSPLAVLVTSTLNLKPLEILLLDGLEVAGVGSSVSENGANVGCGPGAPVEVDFATSGD